MNYPVIVKRTDEQFERHLLRCETCKQTASFVYRFISHNNVEVLKSYWKCHSYCCESCSINKKCKLKRKFKHLVYKHQQGFMTLTLDTKLYTSAQSIMKISEFFNIFVKALRYRGFRFQYFKMIELTKNDVAHIHALISCYIDIKIIQQVWKQITGSIICDIRKPKGKKHAANYVLKYMTKSNDEYQNYIFYVLGKRRYSYSQNYFLPEEVQQPFFQSKMYWNDESEYIFCVNDFFRKKYERFKILDFVFLN